MQSHSGHGTCQRLAAGYDDYLYARYWKSFSSSTICCTGSFYQEAIVIAVAQTKIGQFEVIITQPHHLYFLKIRLWKIQEDISHSFYIFPVF